MEKKALHIPVAYIELEVRNKNGKLLKKYRQPAHSWVRNFMSIMRDAFACTALRHIKQDGASDQIQIGESIGSNFRVDAGAGDDGYGLLVGTGTKAFDVNDYCLDNKIPNGTGSGQLSYGETTVEELANDGSKLYFRVIRTFTNNSGADITVTEIGLAMYGDGKKILLARDVLDNPVTVPNSSTLTVRYIIQYQYA